MRLDAPTIATDVGAHVQAYFGLEAIVANQIGSGTITTNRRDRRGIRLAISAKILRTALAILIVLKHPSVF